MELTLDPTVKTDYFFVEKGERHYLQEFDYEYVRNNLLKVLDLGNREKIYKFLVIVSAHHDAQTGEPVFVTKNVNLRELYYVNTRLRVLDKMIDDITFGKKNSQKNLPVPPLQTMYKEYTENKLKPKLQSTIAPAIPAIKFTRKEVLPTDPRIHAMSDVSTECAVKILDWVDNFEVCNIELTEAVRESSTEQMQMVTILKTSSEKIQEVFTALGETLEDVFNLNPSFIGRMFGSKNVIKESDIETAIHKLQKVVNVDTTKYSGVNVKFNELQETFTKIIDHVEYGIKGCEYGVAKNIQADEFERRMERLMKVRTTNDISKLHIESFRSNFNTNLSKLSEVQQVLVPLLIVRIMESSGKIDDETLNIVKNLAGGKVEVSKIRVSDDAAANMAAMISDTDEN